MPDPVFRILDANCNRLREALRVVEEYFRFIKNDEAPSVQLKQLRHLLTAIEGELGQTNLLEGRDAEQDCFANVNRPEEMARENPVDCARANFKRAQEASRVIEEYAKIVGCSDASQKAKSIRFSLYTMEKQFIAR
jgi:hypothetical protein